MPPPVTYSSAPATTLQDGTYGWPLKVPDGLKVQQDPVTGDLLVVPVANTTNNTPATFTAAPTLTPTPQSTYTQNPLPVPSSSPGATPCCPPVQPQNVHSSGAAAPSNTTHSQTSQAPAGESNFRQYWKLRFDPAKQPLSVYLRQFEVFCDSNNYNDEARRGALIASLTGSAARAAHDLKPNYNYQDLVRALRDRCEPENERAARRQRFMNAHRKPSEESPRVFAERLTDLAYSCFPDELPTFRQEMIIAQFCRGQPMSLATALMSNVYTDLSTAVRVCFQLEETNPAFAKGLPAAASAAIQSLTEFDLDDADEEDSQAIVAQISKFRSGGSGNKRPHSQSGSNNNSPHKPQNPYGNRQGSRNSDDRRKSRNDRFSPRADVRSAEVDEDSDDFIVEAVNVVECMLDTDDDPYPAFVAMVKNRFPSPPSGACLFCGDARHFYARCYKLRDVLRNRGIDQKWDGYVQRATRANSAKPYDISWKNNEPKIINVPSPKPTFLTKKPTFTRELTQEQCDLLDKSQSEN